MNKCLEKRDHKKMSSKLNRKRNVVLSILLRNGKYALFQVLKRPGLIAVFDIFQEKNNWDSDCLRTTPILFKCIIDTKSIFNNSKVFEITNLKPLKHIEMHREWININPIDIREITFWPETKEERTISMLGLGNNLLAVADENKYKTFTPIKLEEYQKVKHLELDCLNIYPHFNERLFLCSELGQNYDPYKEIAFNQELPLICKTYIDIMRVGVERSELGY